MQVKRANLFIVGAMKAGTTSFVEMLQQHPEVYISPIKEPHYFINSLPKSLYEPSRFFELDSYFEKDFPKQHHIAKIEKDEHYQKLFSLAGDEQKYRAEASTAYLHAPESASLIHEYNPEAKIIIITRDPLQRAFSHYKMDLGLGRTSKTFDELITREIEMYNNGSLFLFGYLGMSFYNDAIKRYHELFQNVLVIKFEDLIKEKEQVLERVSNFLEIDDFINLEVSKVNVSKKLRFQKLFFVLKQLGLKDYFSKVFNQSFRQWLFNLFSSDKKQPLDLRPETKEAILQIFTKKSGAV